MNDKIDNINKFFKKNCFSFFRILIVVILIIGGTYAVMIGIGGISISGGSYATEATCFNIDYDVTNGDGTLPISGVLFPSSGYSGGLSGRVSMKINNLCSTSGIGKLNLNVIFASNILTQIVDGHCENKNTLETLTEYATENTCISESDNIWVTTGTALKYAVFDTKNELPVSVGYVDKVGSIEILNDIILSKTVSVFNIYIWLDGNISDNSYANLNFNANISGSAEQIEYYVDDPSFDIHTLMITSYTCDDENGNPVTVGDNPYFTYTGQCEVIDDGEGDWRIKFLTDGTFTSKLNIPIDAFLVGGGGGGSSGSYASGGGGGYTKTIYNEEILSRTSYSIVVGEGGAVETNGNETSAFGTTVSGGYAGVSKSKGGDGGSGGGYHGKLGGSYGSDGVDSKSGKGQGTTTCEFEDGTSSICNDGVDVYSGGGSGQDVAVSTPGGGGAGGSSSNAYGVSGIANTGGGGGGGYKAGASGGSGIVIIRNKRNERNIDFTYTGEFLYIDDGDGNWRVKFLTSGTLTMNNDTKIDAFLVGGGGGGIEGGLQRGGGGGGGYTTTSKGINLVSSQNYTLTIGAGGSGGSTDFKPGTGETTSIVGNDGLNLTAAGGGGAGLNSYGDGGNGGSGGGIGYYYYSGVTYLAGNGGSYGNNGEGVGNATPGTGQGGGTTCEFGEGTTSGCTKGDAYAYAGGGGGAGGGFGGVDGGGAGGSSDSPNGVAGTVNTGGGGGGGGNNSVGGDGGSGIIVIRNFR